MEEKMIKTYDKPVVISPSAHIMNEFDKMTSAQQIELCGRVCYKSEDKMTDLSADGFAGAMIDHKHNSTVEMAPLTVRVTLSENGLSDIGNHPVSIIKLFETEPKFLVIDQINVCEYLISGSVRSFRELVIKHSDCEMGWQLIAGVREIGLFDDLGQPEFGLSTSINVRQLSVKEIDCLPSNLHLRHRQVLVRFIVNRAVTHEIVRHRPCSFLQESQRYCRYSEGKFGSRVTFIDSMFYKVGSEERLLWEKSVLESEATYLKLLETSSPQAARTVLPNSCKTELYMLANLVEWEHFFHLRCGKPAEPSMREVTIPLREEFCKKFPQHSFDRRMPEGWSAK